MKYLHDLIIQEIIKYSEQKGVEELRFTQILFNIGITEFDNNQDPESCGYLYRNNYNISDEEILKKIRK